MGFRRFGTGDGSVLDQTLCVDELRIHYTLTLYARGVATRKG